MVGYGGKTINTLRLWAAAAPDYFDFQRFSSGDFVGAEAETLTAESLTRVLYPDDSTSMGQGLRFVQEYFLVACSLADLVRRFRRTNADWNTLPEKVAIQLNDTHPTMAVPELMRILLDEAHLGWDQAWSLTQRTLAYTNHTLLPEALEKWPVAWFEMLAAPSPGDHLTRSTAACSIPSGAASLATRAASQRISLIEEGASKHVRMANLAIVGSHSTNGVAAIHSKLLRDGDGQGSGRDVSRALQQQDQRRHAADAGCCWRTPPWPARSPQPLATAGSPTSAQLSKLKPLADDRAFRNDFRKAKREAKAQFAQWLKTTSGQMRRSGHHL